MVLANIMNASIESFKLDCTNILAAIEPGMSIKLSEWIMYRDSVLEIITSSGHSKQLSDIQELRMAFGKAYDNQIADLADYMICLERMKENIDNVLSLLVPQKVKHLIMDEYIKRLSDYHKKNFDKYRLDKIEGVIEIRKCILSWLPLGLYDYQISGIPKRNLLLCPTNQKLSFLCYIAKHMRGFSPVYEVHLPKQTGKHLTPESVYESYELLTQVLKMNPSVKGIFSSAWYHDPVVAEINPHLKYLNELFLNNGGYIHKLGSTESCKQDALLKSKTRQQLYAEGKYMPTNYGRYWSRDAMIMWAKSMKADSRQSTGSEKHAL